tara:strand:- start:315 stop:470 length:156 start_codon:yes stop_codon:yes gene_type:complete
MTPTPTTINKNRRFWGRFKNLMDLTICVSILKKRDGDKKFDSSKNLCINNE